MRAYMSDTVPAEPAEGLPGVRLAWIIGRNVGAPNFAMRIVEVDAGCATAYHEHPWEHEVYVLEGRGYVRAGEHQETLLPGTCVFTEPGESHCFANDGDGLLRFICVIPWADA